MKTRTRNYEPGLPFTMDTSHSHLLTIDLLGEGDLKTASTIAQSAANQAGLTGKKDYSTYVKIHNRPMLNSLLLDIERNCDENNNPIIVFDGHGCSNRGLLISSTNMYVPWMELQEELRKINIKTRNKTGIIISSCYGMAVCNGIKINEPVPFQFCIAPKNEIAAGVVETKMQSFMLVLLKTQSMDLAIKELQPDYDYFHSYGHFYSNFIGYLRKYSRGSGRQKFLEELTTKIYQAQPVSGGNIKAARKKARSGIDQQKTHFARLSDVFLHGCVGLPFEKIDEYARAWPKN